MSHGDNVIQNTAQMLGTKGCDYLTTGSLTFVNDVNNKGWYGFQVNETAVVSAVTFKDKDGTTVSFTPTWLSKSLSAGAWIPAGKSSYAGRFVWMTAVTVDSGSILLYRD